MSSIFGKSAKVFLNDVEVGVIEDFDAQLSESVSHDSSCDIPTNQVPDIKCECGKEKHNFMTHMHFCPKFEG